MDNNSKKIIEIVKKISQEEEAILFCYLFGSTTSGKTIPTSDIDLAVYLNKKECKDFFDKRLELIAKFSKNLKKETDVVILNTAPPFLRYVVLKEGKLIFERDEGQRIDFELKSLNEYFDFKPVLDMYNNHLLTN
jgi:predicted nucleotidyltransferase